MKKNYSNSLSSKVLCSQSNSIPCLLYDSGGKMELLVSLRARDGETPLPLFCYWKKLPRPDGINYLPTNLSEECPWADSVTESGIQLPATPNPIKRQGWWKGKFALFWMQATRGRVDSCPKSDTHYKWVRAFIGEGGSSKQSQLWQSSSN